MSTHESSRRAGIDESTLLDWESGAEFPSFAQLRKLAELYDRPVAAFFLPTPPRDFDVGRAFRKMPDMVEESVLSSALTLHIRGSEDRRAVLLDLAREVGAEWPRFVLRRQPGETAQSLAGRVRDHFRISINEQLSWSAPSEAYRNWRGALEGSGVLVFQTSRIDVSEMRGYSIVHDVAPVITVNTKDDYHPRIFTLMHELGHLLRRKSNICDPQTGKSHWIDPDEEVFCNEFAGEILVPSDALEAMIEPSELDDSPFGISSSELRRLSSKFRVSDEVLARRLLATGHISKAHYRAWRALFESAGARPKKQRKSPIVPVDVKTVANLGRPYVRTVLEALHNDRITLSDVASFLGVKLKHLKKIERRAFGGGNLDPLGDPI